MDALAPAVERLFASDAPCDGTLLTNVRHETAIRTARDSIDRTLDSLTSGATPDAILLDVEEALSREDVPDLTKKLIQSALSGKSMKHIDYKGTTRYGEYSFYGFE